MLASPAPLSPLPDAPEPDISNVAVARAIFQLREATLLRNDVYAFTMDDPRRQAFVMLRSRLLRYAKRTSARLIAVTSARPREGKSFVSLNLAAALSHIHPTWLIDADLRNPSIAQRLGFRPAKGVDTFLTGEDPIVPLRCTSGRDMMTLMTIREARADSAGLLTSPRAAELFATLRAQAGDAVCIVDTPPVLEGDDMLILAPYFDAVLLVVEEGRTLQSDLRESLSLLEPTPLMGTILNRALMADSAMYYGSYPYRPET